MALIINDFETFVVPENLVLIIKDGSVFKSKKHNGTIGTVTADDMFRLDLTAESLPRYVFETDYEAVKLQAARVNPDMNNAFSTTAAAKAIDAVDAKKISKSEFATEQQLNKESHEELQANIDAEEAARKEEILQYNKDYTAVEVYPTNAVIPAGTVDEVTGLTYKFAVPANMKAQFKLRTICELSESDIIVDWGDGSRTDIKEVPAADTAWDGNELNVNISHTYAEPGRYIVKFFGKKYFGFGSVETIVSRVFASDLPVAKHLNCIGNLAYGSKRLLSVDIPSYILSAGLYNLNAMFNNNVNLVSATGLRYATWFFNNCPALENTDFIIPGYLRDGGLNTMFKGCSSLAVDISKLFPNSGFVGEGTQSAKDAFRGCVALTGTVPADKLWRNTKIKWTDTANAFSDCSEAIRLQVPVSWGGLNEEEDAAITAGTYTCATKKEVADLAAASSSTTGQDAIVVSGEGATKTVSLALDESDNVTLSQSATGLKTELKIAKKETANEGYAATYQLVDANGTPIVGSADINMVKDQFLKGAGLVTGTYNEETQEFIAGVGPQYNKYIHFVFEVTKSGADDTATDTDSHIYINVNDLFDSYTAGNGAIVIDQNANTISVAISSESESVTIGQGSTGAVISIAADGLKISNIQNAIDYAVGVEAAARQAADADLDARKVESVLTTVGGGRALIFNEADGGGAKVERADGSAYFVGVNDSDGDRSNNHAVASIYALNSNKTGIRFTVFNDMITYKANATKADRNNSDYELAVKADVISVSADLTTHAALDTRHTAEVMFIRSTQTIEELAYNQYICKAALTGTLPAAPAEGTKRIISVLAGGEGTVISAATGDKINGLTTGLAINIANETVTLIYDAADKNWVVL